MSKTLTAPARPSWFDRLIVLALIALGLSGCAQPTDTSSTLYATSIDKAYAILVATDLPPDIFGGEAIFNDGAPNKLESPTGSVTWQFERRGMPLVLAQVFLRSEGGATRITTAVVAANPAQTSNAAMKELVSAVEASPVLREVLRENLAEFVDATLSARAVDPQRGGGAFAASHQAELATERQTLADVLAKLKSKPVAPMSNTALPPKAMAGSTEFGAPMLDARPTTDAIPQEQGASSPNAAAPAAPPQPIAHDAPPTEIHLNPKAPIIR